MATLDLPKIRRALSGREVRHQGESYIRFQDEQGAFDGPVMVPTPWYHLLLRHFDGKTGIAEHQTRVLKETGQLIPRDRLTEIVADLDRAMLLEGPTFQRFMDEYRASRVHRSVHAGQAYAATEKALKAQLAGYFHHPEGAGSHDDAGPKGDLRGILSPHIDFQRGGLVYTHAYRQLVERSDAEIFVVFGVAHRYCERRFALTYKDFETPLGVARTDRGFVDRLSRAAGDIYFDDEIAHRTEHSIEFQVVFLQYLLGERRDYSIAPILVGSFHDHMTAGAEPLDDPEIARFVAAVRDAERASGKKVCYIGGIDLCHVGPEFGDPEPVSDALLSSIREFDERMLTKAAACDPTGWFRSAAEVGNRWRVCGLAATYTMLHTMGPAVGRVLRYDQAVDARRTCCVSFAGVSYESVRTGSAEIQTP